MEGLRWWDSWATAGRARPRLRADIVRSTEARRGFHDGIVWLLVNDGAKSRLP